MAFTDLSYTVGQGVLYAARRTMNGAQTGGFIDLGDVADFTIDPKQTFEDIEENRSGFGFTAAHVPTMTKLNVKMTVAQQSQANWERAVYGTASGSIAGATVTGESIVLYNGAMTPLAHPGVSSVTLSSGVLGTDYTVDAVNGAINVLAASTVFVAGTPTTVTANYTYATYTGKVEAFTTAQPIFILRLHQENTANGGQPAQVDVYQWAPDMADMLEFISKKHMTFKLNGMLLQDQSKPLPTAASPLSQFFKVTRG